MDYSTLVDTVLKCKPLKDAVEDIQVRTNPVNLISPDWEDILNNSPNYQAHLQKKVKYSKGKICAKDKAYIRNIISPLDQYNIIVVGEFGLNKLEDDTYSFYCIRCDPLTKIGFSMRETDEKQLHDGGRFFVKICEPRYCYPCTEYHKKFSVPYANKNWCIMTTRVYDGRQIKSEFASILQPALLNMGSFMGILHMQIISRTTFGSYDYKIGGTIKEMIVFQQSALVPSFDLNLTYINIPNIEYPKEDEMVEVIPKN